MKYVSGAMLGVLISFLPLGVRAGWQAFDYPAAEPIMQMTTLGEGFLLRREIFFSGASPEALLSFYEAVLESAGWQADRELRTGGRGCPSCPGLGGQARIWNFRRQEALFSVELLPSVGGRPVAAWSLRMPARTSLPVPLLQRHQPLYPHGRTLRVTQTDTREGRMRAYEFECTDNPGVFFAHLERSLSGGAWQQNEHLVWLNRLTAQRTMALYERAGARLSVIAGGERGGRWHYTIIFREMSYEQA